MHTTVHVIEHDKTHLASFLQNCTRIYALILFHAFLKAALIFGDPFNNFKTILAAFALSILMRSLAFTAKRLRMRLFLNVRCAGTWDREAFAHHRAAQRVVVGIVVLHDKQDVVLHDQHVRHCPAAASSFHKTHAAALVQLQAHKLQRHQIASSEDSSREHDPRLVLAILARPRPWVARSFLNAVLAWCQCVSRYTSSTYTGKWHILRLAKGAHFVSRVHNWAHRGHSVVNASVKERERCVCEWLPLSTNLLLIIVIDWLIQCHNTTTGRVISTAGSYV